MTTNPISTIEIRVGDCRELLAAMPDRSVHCAVTSPPYFGLRDYGVDGQIGLEQTPDEFVAELVAVFREVRRVLRDDGTLWLNLGDTYGSSKSLKAIPWKVAIALSEDGWVLRQDIIWHKPNPMPESVKDRLTRSHEYLFLLAKNERYYFDARSIKEPLTRPEEGKRKTPAVFGGRDKHLISGAQSRLYSGKAYTGTDDGKRNKRSVWTVSLKPFKGAHCAVFPPDLIEPCILAGCPEGGTVLDPFGGAGTTGLVAQRHNRDAILLELNPAYADLARERLGLPVASRLSPVGVFA